MLNIVICCELHHHLFQNAKFMMPLVCPQAQVCKNKNNNLGTKVRLFTHC